MAHKEVNPIEQYYAEIEAGRILVSAKVKRVYRHLVEKIHNPDQYIYDNQKAMYAIEFIETFCKHSKGEWAGKPVILEL